MKWRRHSALTGPISNPITTGEPDHQEAPIIEATTSNRFFRTFLILEQMLPRLKFAKQKIDTMIDAFTERQADLVP